MIKAIYNIWLSIASEHNEAFDASNQSISPSEDVLIRNYYSCPEPQEGIYIYPDTWIKPE